MFVCVYVRSETETERKEKTKDKNLHNIPKNM